ncbi:MAG: hypothetical protein JO128_13980 [Alphaproteobacteria bacterium]|nr:hypothetical protein [Alphaproteobacteria bacterium]
MDLVQPKKKSPLKVEFEIGDYVSGTAYPTALPADTQRQFQTDFYERLGTLEAWFRTNGWLTGPLKRPDPIGSVAPPWLFSLPDTDLRVCVSNKFDHGSALLPATIGQRGRVEFPESRVASGTADITHELAHVLFPNGNRMLAEGLAVYLQQKIGVNPAFPNFGKNLDQAVRDLLPGLGPHALEKIDLSAFDVVPTPNDLVVQIGETWCQDDTTYVIAGSFVQFLIEHFGGADKFYKLYMQTRLVPFGWNVGDPGRWITFYGQTLDKIAARWKQRIADVKSARRPRRAGE